MLQMCIWETHLATGSLQHIEQVAELLKRSFGQFWQKVDMEQYNFDTTICPSQKCLSVHTVCIGTMWHRRCRHDAALSAVVGGQLSAHSDGCELVELPAEPGAAIILAARSLALSVDVN